LPEEGLDRRIGLARPQQALAGLRQRRHDGVLLLHGEPSFFPGRGREAGTSTLSTWSRKASARSSGRALKKRRPVSFSISRAEVRYFAQSCVTLWSGPAPTAPTPGQRPRVSAAVVGMVGMSRPPLRKKRTGSRRRIA